MTGVQTCALPISGKGLLSSSQPLFCMDAIITSFSLLVNSFFLGGYGRVAFFRAAWRRPLEVTGLGAFGPKTLLLPPSTQNTPLGCICGVLDCRAAASYFLFLSQKESKQRKMLPPERCERSFAPCGERPGRCPGPASL